MSPFSLVSIGNSDICKKKKITVSEKNATDKNKKKVRLLKIILLHWIWLLFGQRDLILKQVSMLDLVRYFCVESGAPAGAPTRRRGNIFGRVHRPREYKIQRLITVAHDRARSYETCLINRTLWRHRKYRTTVYQTNQASENFVTTISRHLRCLWQS